VAVAVAVVAVVAVMGAAVMGAVASPVRRKCPSDSRA